MIDRRKKSKTLSEVKPVENISMNLKSFLEIVPCKGKSFLQINYETKYMSTRILSD